MRTVAIAVLLLGLTSCGTSYDPNEDLPSCAEQSCDEETKAVAETLEQLPDVTMVEDVRWVAGKALSWPEVKGSIVIASMDPDDCYELSEQLAQVVWESGMAPIEGYNFDCTATGSGSPTQLWEHWDEDAVNALYDKYGERAPR